MKDYCTRCDLKKEGFYDNDPDTGTGWFWCFKCWEIHEEGIRKDLQRDYDWYNSLPPEQQAEVKSEYRQHGVYDFPP